MVSDTQCYQLDSPSVRLSSVTKVRKSSNNDVVRIYYDTNSDTNLQYNQFKSTKEAITQYRKNKENRITTVLTTQSLVIKSIWEHGMKSAVEIWFK